MNEKQSKAFQILKAELSEPNRCENLGEADGYLFTEVDGVTVVIGSHGGFHLPTVRTYPGTSRLGEKALDAAIDPRHWWKRRRQGNHKTGHLAATVGLDWRCKDLDCACRRENSSQLRKRNGLN